MEWHDIVVTAGVMLAVFGGITIIGNGVKIIKEMVNPVTELQKRTETLEKRADATDAKYEQIKRVMNAQSRLLIEMSTHLITGNDIDALKERRDELTDAMIE